MHTYNKLLEQYVKCLSLKEEYIHTDNDASYLTIKEGSKLYIYFEWSNGIKDWINNFRFLAKWSNGIRDWVNSLRYLARPTRPYKEMKRGGWFCHRGFLGVWKTIEPLIADQIRDVTIDEIEIVGYSHGAAIAQLCYEYVKFHRQDVTVTGVGFGSPRVVWGFISKEAKTRFKGFKVVRNCNDIVTHVPPVLFGFRHLAEVIKIGSDSEGLIDDHREANYINSLEDAATVELYTNAPGSPCTMCGKIVGEEWYLREDKIVCSKCADTYDKEH